MPSIAGLQYPRTFLTYLPGGIILVVRSSMCVGFSHRTLLIGRQDARALLYGIRLGHVIFTHIFDLPRGTPGEKDLFPQVQRFLWKVLKRPFFKLSDLWL